ncbi:MAG: diacylglycerol kinase family lipid kinase [Actinobacteria bacterium]|nr:diacylglycerol kinase family lipid kinase [Actinomycetota bacterium]MCG2800952.1 diacylglycerol kinase family lipid kinase [Cellulomonas sp.]
MSRLGLVVNPTSGHGRGRDAGRRAHARFVAAGHEVLDLSAPTLAQSTDAARAAALRGLDALVVVGGDGMTHLGVNVVATTPLPLGIVAAGSGNDIARVLGLPLHDVPAAVDLVDRSLVLGARAVDAVRVTTPGREAAEWFVGVLSCGIDAAVNARANRLRFPSGTGRYVRALFGELASFRPYGYRVSFDDGSTWESPGVLVAAANTGDIGGGMHIAPDADPGDGLLDVVTGAGLGRSELLRLFPAIFRGTHVHHPAVRVVRTRSVLVDWAPEHGPHPPVAFADGERIGPLPLRAEVVRGALKVLVGAASAPHAAAPTRTRPAGT